MKALKRFSLGVILATLMLMMCSISVCAATKTKTLSAGTWAKETGTGDTTYRKITIKNDGYITVDMKKSNTNHVDIYICDQSKNYLSSLFCTNDKKGTVKYAVTKGTYYIYSSSYTACQYKYKATKVSYGSNYCASKATTLKAGKTATIVQTAMNNYNRWYKIKLTKNKVITYWLKGNGSVTLYDSNFNELSTVSADDGQYYTYSKQKKGTYYARINDYYWYYWNNQASMCTFKWK